MKIAILSTAPRCYSTRRLRQAAVERGHTVRVLNTLRFGIELEHGEPDLYFRGKQLSHYDAVLPRIGASLTYFGTAVVRQFEQMDVYTPNTAAGIASSRDKLRALQILSRHDIGIPHTTFVRDRKDVLPAIERIGGAPVIIKILEGTQGVGVILADNNKVAEAIIETMQSARQNVLVQAFIKESKGRDLRAFVVGDRVVAAMRRVAQGNEFRSNVHRGGRTEVVKLDSIYEETAVRAAQILGLRVAGVDMLEGNDGPQIMEVNSSPGLEGIEGCTGLDIAGAIMDYISDQVDFPELDLRQRLTVSKGYGVAQLLIRDGLELVGKTIAESMLRDRDVIVLTLNRGTSVISNPKSSRVLEAGDSLLCYGKLEAMRDLVPDRRNRKRKRKVKKLDPDLLGHLGRGDRMGEPKRDVSQWGGVTIGPGERRKVNIVISETYSGTDIGVPAYVWRGQQPGPTVFVTGAVHGDEINGTGVIRSIIVDRPFKLEAGTLIMVPVINLPGFDRHERYLPDRRDLNRCFPGTKRGSLASRMARVIFDEIVGRSDFGIDLHTAALRRTNFPNVRADMTNPQLAELARAFGTELIVSSGGPVGSLRKSATRAGCPTLILEAGEVWKVEPTVVEYGILGIINCLRYLGMVEGDLVVPPYRVETDATLWVRAQKGGFLRFHVTPGDLVEKGQPLASNISLVGKRLNVIKAPRAGFVLGMITLPAVAPGDPICHLAFPRAGDLRRIERAVEGMDSNTLHERVREDLARSVFVKRD